MTDLSRPTPAAPAVYRPPNTCDVLWGQLTDRQRDVVRLIGGGSTNKQIAAALAITQRRVQIHVTAIAFRLGCDREKDARAQIVAWWVRCGERPAA